MDLVSKQRKADNAGNSTQTGITKRIIGRPFLPGKSGNPSGRPKKKPITKIYEELFDDPEARAAIKEQVRATMTSRGMAGVLERREAADRIEGKVTQELDVALDITLQYAQAVARIRARRANLEPTGTDRGNS